MFGKSTLASSIFEGEQGKRVMPKPAISSTKKNLRPDQALSQQNHELMNLKYENQLLQQKLNRVVKNSEEQTNFFKNPLKQSAEEVNLNYNNKSNYINILHHQLNSSNELLEAKDLAIFQKAFADLRIENDFIKEEHSRLKVKYHKLKERYLEIEKNKRFYETMSETAKRMRDILHEYERLGKINVLTLGSMDFTEFDEVLYGRKLDRIRNIPERLDNAQTAQQAGLAVSRVSAEAINTPSFNEDPNMGLSIKSAQQEKEEDNFDKKIQNAELNSVYDDAQLSQAGMLSVKEGVSKYENYNKTRKNEDERFSKKSIGNSQPEDYSLYSKTEFRPKKNEKSENLRKYSSKERNFMKVKELELDISDVRNKDIIEPAQNSSQHLINNVKEEQLSRESSLQNKSPSNIENQNSMTSENKKDSLQKIPSQKSNNKITQNDSLEKSASNQGTPKRPFIQEQNQPILSPMTPIEITQSKENNQFESPFYQNSESVQEPIRIEKTVPSRPSAVQEVQSKISNRQSNAAMAQIDTLQEENNLLSNIIKRKEAMIEDLQIQMEQLQAEHARKIEDHINELAETKEKLKTKALETQEMLNAQINELTNDHLNETNELKEEFRIAEQKKTEEIDKVTVQLIETREQLDNATKQAIEAESKNREAQKDRELAEAKIKIYQDKLETARAEQRSSVTKLLNSELKQSMIPKSIRDSMIPEDRIKAQNNNEEIKARMEQIRIYKEEQDQKIMELEDTILELTNAREKAEAQYRQVEASKALENLQKDNMELRAAELKEQIQDLTDTIAARTRNLNEWQNRVAALEEEIAVSNKRFLDSEREKQAIIFDLQDANEEIERFNNKQRNANVDIQVEQSKALALEADVRNKDEAIAHLSDKLENLERNFEEEMQKQMKLFEENLENKRESNEMRQMKIQSEKIQEEAQRVQEEIQQTQLEKSQLTEQLNLKEEQVSKLAQVVQALQQEMNGLQEMMKLKQEKSKRHAKEFFKKESTNETEEQLELFKQLLSLKEKEVEEMTQKTNSNEELKNQLVQAKIELEGKRVAMADDFRNLREQVTKLSKYQQAFEEMEKSVDGSREAFLKIGELTKEVEDLKSEAIQKDFERDNLRAQVSQAAVDYSFLQQEAETLKREKEAARLLEKEFELTAVGFEAQKSKLLEINKQLETAETDNSELRKELAEFSKKLPEATSNLDAEKLTIKILKSQILKLEKTNSSLEIQITQGEQEKKALKSAFEEEDADNKKRLKFMENRLADLKKLNDPMSDVEKILEEKDAQIFEMAKVSNQRRDENNRLKQKSSELSKTNEMLGTEFDKMRMVLNEKKNATGQIEELTAQTLQQQRLKYKIPESNYNTPYEAFLIFSMLDEKQKRIDEITNISEMQKRFNSFSVRISSLEEEIKEHLMLIEKLKQNLENQEFQLSTSQRRVSALETEKQTLEQKLDQRSHEITELNGKIKTQNFVLSQKEEQLAFLKNTNADLHKMVALKDDAYSNLQELHALNVTENISDEKKASLNRARDEVLISRNEKLVYEIEKLKRDLFNLNSEFLKREELLINELEAEKKTVLHLKSQLVGLEEGADENKRRSTRLHGDTQALQEEVDRLKFELSNAEKKCEVLIRLSKFEVEEFPKLEEFAVLKEKIIDLEGKLNALEEKNNELESGNQKLQEKAIGDAAQMQIVQSSLEDRNAEIEKLKEDLDRLNKTFALEVKRLEVELSTKQDINNELEDEVDELEKKTKALKDEVAYLTEELKRLQRMPVAETKIETGDSVQNQSITGTQMGVRNSVTQSGHVETQTVESQPQTEVINENLEGTTMGLRKSVEARGNEISAVQINTKESIASKSELQEEEVAQSVTETAKGVENFGGASAAPKESEIKEAVPSGHESEAKPESIKETKRQTVDENKFTTGAGVQRLPLHFEVDKVNENTDIDATTTEFGTTEGIRNSVPEPGKSAQLKDESNIAIQEASMKNPKILNQPEKSTVPEKEEYPVITSTFGTRNSDRVILQPGVDQSKDRLNDTIDPLPDNVKPQVDQDEIRESVVVPSKKSIHPFENIQDKKIEEASHFPSSRISDLSIKLGQNESAPIRKETPVPSFKDKEPHIPTRSESIKELFSQVEPFSRNQSAENNSTDKISEEAAPQPSFYTIKNERDTYLDMLKNENMDDSLVRTESERYLMSQIPVDKTPSKGPSQNLNFQKKEASIASSFFVESQKVQEKKSEIMDKFKLKEESHRLLQKVQESDINRPMEKANPSNELKQLTLLRSHLKLESERRANLQETSIHEQPLFTKDIDLDSEKEAKTAEQVRDEHLNELKSLLAMQDNLQAQIEKSQRSSGTDQSQQEKIQNLIQHTNAHIRNLTNEILKEALTSNSHEQLQRSLMQSSVNSPAENPFKTLIGIVDNHIQHLKDKTSAEVLGREK